MYRPYINPVDDDEELVLCRGAADCALCKKCARYSPKTTSDHRFLVPPGAKDKCEAYEEQ